MERIKAGKSPISKSEKIKLFDYLNELIGFGLRMRKGINILQNLYNVQKMKSYKVRMDVTEIYLHTTEIRGREHYFAEDYEAPTDNFLDLDTTNISIDECIEKIVKVIK